MNVKYDMVTKKPAPQPENADKASAGPAATGDAFHKGWRQVRLFTRNVNRPDWHQEFLGTVVKQFWQQNPKTIFFVSRYICTLGEDDGDTDISKLPPDFLFIRPGKKQIHFSIRLRFKPESDEEGKLSAAVKEIPHLWHSGFLNFKMPGGLAGDRFATAQDTESQERRGRLVAELLCANSRLLLDSLACNSDQWDFEPNKNELNQPCGLAAQSTFHMVVNPWCLKDANPLPIFVRVNDSQFAQL
jgi:hypothetical protein